MAQVLGLEILRASYDKYMEALDVIYSTLWRASKLNFASQNTLPPTPRQGLPTDVFSIFFGVLITGR